MPRRVNPQLDIPVPNYLPAIIFAQRSAFSAKLFSGSAYRMPRETFATYRKQGGSVIQRPSRIENVQTASNSPLTMIASDGSQLLIGERADQKSPTVRPSSSMSTLRAAGSLPRPGICWMAPASGTSHPAPV